jgi:putative flavoprotein involved in K+ transport
MHDAASATLVIGAGPAGLAAARCLKDEGVAFRLVDRRGVPGGAYLDMYAAISLASPTRYTALPGSALVDVTSGEYVTAGEYRAYLSRYAAAHRLMPEAAEVLEVRRDPDGFRVEMAGGTGSARFRFVVVATGMFDHPILPEIPGLPGAGEAGELEVLHARSWRGPGPFSGRRLLVIGGATSAVEIAAEAARAGVGVTVSARGRRVRLAPQRLLGRDVHDWAYLLAWLPRWALGSYCNRRPTLPGSDIDFSRLVREGRIEIAPEVVSFAGRTAHWADGSRRDVDAVVLATGYRFDMPFLPADVARARPAGHPLADGGESRSWPDLFFVGTPCARSLFSEFLHGVAHDTPVVARRIRERL